MNENIKKTLEEFFEHIWGFDWKEYRQELNFKNRERWTDKELMEFLTDLAENIDCEISRMMDKIIEAVENCEIAENAREKAIEAIKKVIE